MGEQKLTREELIDYFKDVFELESQLYTYNRIDKKYVDELSHVGIPNILSLQYMQYGRFVSAEHIEESYVPVISGCFLDKTPKPEWKQTKEFREVMKTKKVVKFKHFMKLLKITIIFALIILFLAFFLFGTKALPSLCIFGAFPYLICIILTICSYSYEEDSKILSRKLATYYAKCVAHESELIAQSEMPLRIHIEKEHNELVIKPQKEVRRLLDKIYSKNIIFPKYRNLAAIAQIYEYLVSGRCTELEGPDGAYNLYESELRQNIIINKLDEIIKQLETLNDTMSTMCSAIQTTNRLLGNISQTLGRIETNTALSAYNTQCIANNTNIANRYYY